MCSNNVIQRYSTLFNVTPKNLAKLLGNIDYFSYLCSAKQHQTQFMESTKSYGRTELAQLYFPNILPCNAWQKLRALMQEDPALSDLTKLKRRSFLPVEVNLIYQHLGRP